MELSESVKNWASAIGSAASSVGSWLSGLWSSAKQESMNKEQMLFASDEAQKQRSWQEKMWNAENAYNTPANQIALMKEAGLNPNKFETSLTPASSAGSGAAASTPSGMQNPQLVAAQTRLANAEADKSSIEAIDRLQKSPLEKKLLQIEAKFKDVQMQGLFSQMRVDRAHEQEYLASATNLYSSANNFNQAVQESVQRSEYIQEQSNVARAELNRLNYENSRQKEYWNAKIKDLVADANKKFAEAGLAIKNQDLVTQQISNAITQGKLLDVQFEVSDGTKSSTIRAYNAENNKIVLDAQSDTSSPDFIEYRAWMRATGSAFGVLGNGIRAAAVLAPK